MSTRRLLGIIGMALFVVSLVSLFMAYIWSGSRVWELQFGLGSEFGVGVPEYLPGMIIEILQSAIVLGGTFLLVGSVFLSEFECIFGLKQATPRTQQFVGPIRVVLLPLTLVVLFLVLKYNLHDAPAALPTLPEWKARGGDATLAAASGAKFFHTFVLPYWCYSAYAIVTFVFAGCILAPSAFLAAITDIDFVRRKHDQLEKDFTPPSGTPLNCTEIENGFGDFYREVVKVIGRYGYFMLAISVASSYEFYIGHLILAPHAWVWTWVGLGIMVVACLLLFFIFSYFSSAYADASDILLKQRCKDSKISDYSTMMSELGHRYGHLYVLAGLFNLAPIAQVAIEKLKVLLR